MSKFGALTPLPGKQACLSYDRDGAFGRGDCRLGTLGGQRLVLTPDERFVYVAAEEGGLAGYLRNRRNGALRRLARGCLAPAFLPEDPSFDSLELEEAARGSGCLRSRFLADGMGAGLAVSPDGRHLYVGGADSSEQPGDEGPPLISLSAALVIFERDPGTGRLRQVGCVAADAAAGCSTARALGGRILAVAISRDGRTLYAAASAGSEPPSASIAAFSRDPQSGLLTQLPGSAGCVASGPATGCESGRGMGDRLPSDLALAPDGQQLYLATQAVYFRDTGTLAAFRTSPETGALIQLPGPAGCIAAGGEEGCARSRPLGDDFSDPHGLTLSGNGANAYNIFGSADAGAIRALRRDVNTGALAELSGAGGCLSWLRLQGCGPARALQSPSDVEVSPDGRNVYVAASDGALAVFARRRGAGALAQLPGRAGCVGGYHGPPIPGPPGSPRGLSDERCAVAAGVGHPASIALTRDGAYAYVADDYVEAGGLVGALARNAPRIHVRIARPCGSRAATVRIAVRAFARLRRLRVKLDGREIRRTTRRRIELALPQGLLASRRVHRLRFSATDARGRRSARTSRVRRCSRRAP